MLLTLVVGASAQSESVLVIGWEQEPTLLTPRQDMAFGSLLTNFYARDVWDWDVNRQIFPVMVAEIPSFENGLVKTLDNGNTQVTYKLREGLKWSDGQPITSKDCAFFHELRMDPTKITIQRGSYPEVVESFEVVDDTTFVLTYNVPFPDYLSNATASCYLPEHVFRAQLDAEGNIDSHPYFSGQGVVGYGPYVLSEWVVGSQFVFTKNPNWDLQEPAFSRVVARIITDTAQMKNALEAGEIDVAFNFSDDLVDSYSAIPNTEVFKTDGVFGDAIWMNVGNYQGKQEAHPILGDPKVREALIRAIDRASLAEELVGPGVGVPKSWYPAAFWPDDLSFWDYNPELAKQLLDEAGWVDSNGDGTRDKDGMEMVLRFYTTTRQIRIDYQVVIQEYLNEVGVGTQLLPVPANLLFGSFVERGILNTGDFDLAIFALSSNPLSPFADAPSWFGCDGVPTAEDPNGNNGWGSCDPEFDRLDLLVGATVDPDERLGYAQEAQRAFFNMGHWHGLYLRPTWYAINSAVVQIDENVKNVGTLSGNYFNRVEYWQPAG
jgi:peptide/nickel transport system substrate-binding protein